MLELKYWVEKISKTKRVEDELILLIFFSTKFLTSFCSMTFCFSFEVIVTLNPIQLNIEGGGPKKSPRTSSIVQIIYVFLLILRDQLGYSEK